MRRLRPNGHPLDARRRRPRPRPVLKGQGPRLAMQPTRELDDVARLCLVVGSADIAAGRHADYSARGRRHVDGPGPGRRRAVGVARGVGRPHVERVRAIGEAGVGLGDAQAAQAPPSRRHWNLEPASLELKPKLADPLATVPDGPESIVVSGAVVSAEAARSPSRSATPASRRCSPRRRSRARRRCAIRSRDRRRPSVSSRRPRRRRPGGTEGRT